MLGVRRPGVTEAAGQLQEEKLLRYRHGEMQVLNRAGLERRACQCYEIFNQLYTKNLPAKK
jgi:Mn-dependent DtxR family transcriptional regulator